MDSITIAVLPAGVKTPTRLGRFPNDLPKLKKWIERVARTPIGAIASGRRSPSSLSLGSSLDFCGQ